MGQGQCQSPWTPGVGWFHGTLDINAPPLLEVNNSAHSIKRTCTSAVHARTHTPHGRRHFHLYTQRPRRRSDPDGRSSKITF